MRIGDITELTVYESWQTADLNSLVEELGDGCHATSHRVKATIESDNSHLYVAVDSDTVNNSGSPVRIVACATLCVCQTPEMTIGTVEAVVVSPLYRGLHLGRAMMLHVIKEAKRMGVTDLHLTSSPKRLQANVLYRSLGFEKRDTNFYLMRL